MGAKYSISDKRDGFHLSEAYLIKAEAYARLDETEAQDALEPIRQRAILQAIATTATGDAPIQAIIEERRKELAFNGFRLFNLART